MQLRRALGLLPLALLFVAWEVAVELKVYPQVLLPAPAKVAFVVLGVIGAMCFAGLGLLTASRARTIEMVSGLMNLIMMPMWIVSGVFFSSANFPAVMQPLIKVLPLTALNDALRAVILDGASLAAVALPAAICVAWGAVSFAVALKIFRWL